MNQAAGESGAFDGVSPHPPRLEVVEVPGGAVATAVVVAPDGYLIRGVNWKLSLLIGHQGSCRLMATAYLRSDSIKWLEYEY